MTQEFVTLPRAVVEQVIDALYCTDSEEGSPAYNFELKAVKELRAVLEQPQAEQPAMTPIAQRKLEGLMASGYTISGYSVYHERKHQHGFVTGAGLVGWWKPEGMEYPQPLGEQEPVAFAIFTEAGNARMWSTLQPHVQKLADAEGLTVTPLYTHPQPKREPLTNEQVKAGLIHSIEYTDARERCAFNIGVRFAERAHGIK